jgi:hypothetical protein
MPEMNFRVKVKGGKRTNLEVTVAPMVYKKTITLRSGVVVTSQALESIIDQAIIKYIGTLPRPGKE